MHEQLPDVAVPRVVGVELVAWCLVTSRHVLLVVDELVRLPDRVTPVGQDVRPHEGVGALPRLSAACSRGMHIALGGQQEVGGVRRGPSMVQGSSL